MSDVNLIALIFCSVLFVAPMFALMVILLVAAARGIWREVSEEPTHD